MMPTDLQEMIQRVDDAIDMGSIEVSQWEISFIEDIGDRNHLSDKQIAVLVKIHNRTIP